MRIGTGYDVHRLASDRKLIVGGVDIPYEKGLLGHSDADVLLHAIMDALLGAAALGDIGKLFPDTDERYRGISSLKLLAAVGDLLLENHWIIENIDATIIAQAPKMRPYIDEMRLNIAKTLGLDIAQVNVKATTEEGLGFTGRGEGISSQAVCLLSAVEELCEDNITVADSARSCESCPGCPASTAGSVSKESPKKEKKRNKKESSAKKDSKTKDKKKDKKSKKKAGSAK
ncbi:MAG: 2-C-methyl-D-erythritol 2,4-cyclodiphosphate synthase [Lachnospiraceae bacterium]|nr:2-C-methyl-D-erythritol 2,4-cyclodiphosphate synthase [Lachnospiraceae bacterium]